MIYKPHKTANQKQSPLPANTISIWAQAPTKQNRTKKIPKNYKTTQITQLEYKTARADRKNDGLSVGAALGDVDVGFALVEALVIYPVT